MCRIPVISVLAQPTISSRSEPSRGIRRWPKTRTVQDIGRGHPLTGRALGPSDPKPYPAVPKGFDGYVIANFSISLALSPTNESGVFGEAKRIGLPYRRWLISAIPGISLPEVRQRIRQSAPKGRSRYDWRSVSSVRVCCGDLRALVAALSARYLWRCNVDPVAPILFAFPRGPDVYPYGRPRSGARKAANGRDGRASAYPSETKPRRMKCTIVHTQRTAA